MTTTTTREIDGQTITTTRTLEVKCAFGGHNVWHVETDVTTDERVRHYTERFDTEAEALAWIKWA